MSIKITGKKGTAVVASNGAKKNPNVVTIPKGGEFDLDAELLQQIGEGPYTFKVTKTDPNAGKSTVNGMSDVTILGGDNVTVTVNTDESTLSIDADVPTKLSEFQNDSSFATTSDVSQAVAEIQVPTKTSQLQNDSSFATTSEVSEAVAEIQVPTKTSQLQNDSSYATTSQVSQAVSGIQVPTTTSQLQNDAQFATTTEVNQAIQSAVLASWSKSY